MPGGNAPKSPGAQADSPNLCVALIPGLGQCEGNPVLCPETIFVALISEALLEILHESWIGHDRNAFHVVHSTGLFVSRAAYVSLQNVQGPSKRMNCAGVMLLPANKVTPSASLQMCCRSSGYNFSCIHHLPWLNPHARPLALRLASRGPAPSRWHLPTLPALAQDQRNLHIGKMRSNPRLTCLKAGQKEPVGVYNRATVRKMSIVKIMHGVYCGHCSGANPCNGSSFATLTTFWVRLSGSKSGPGCWVMWG